MTLKLMKLVLFAVFCISGTFCDRSECKNLNPAFEKFSPGANEYKAELAKQIQTIGAENLGYSHDKYVKKNGKEYIVVNIQGGTLCAQGEIEVTNWDKLAGLRREVSGYRGAGLQGLQYEIRKESGQTNFYYKDIKRIID